MFKVMVLNICDLVFISNSYYGQFLVVVNYPRNNAPRTSCIIHIRPKLQPAQSLPFCLYL